MYPQYQNDRLQAGDLIFYSWKGNANLETGQGIDHTAVATGTTGTEIHGSGEFPGSEVDERSAVGLAERKHVWYGLYPHMDCAQQKNSELIFVHIQK